MLLGRDEYIELAVDLGTITGQEDRGGIKLGNDGGADHLVGRFEPAAIVDLGRDPFSLPIDLMFIDFSMGNSSCCSRITGLMAVR